MPLSEGGGDHVSWTRKIATKRNRKSKIGKWWKYISNNGHNSLQKHTSQYFVSVSEMGSSNHFCHNEFLYMGSYTGPNGILKFYGFVLQRIDYNDRARFLSLFVWSYGKVDTVPGLDFCLHRHNHWQRMATNATDMINKARAYIWQCARARIVGRGHREIKEQEEGGSTARVQH